MANLDFLSKYNQVILPQALDKDRPKIFPQDFLPSAKKTQTMADCTFLTKYQVILPESSKPALFPEDFLPSAKDVICGRGKATFCHVGNRRFRVIIAMNLQKYVTAKTKADKSLIVTSIVDQMREGSPNGGFLKKDTKTGRWIVLDDNLARAKVGHALRDAFASTKEAMKQSSMLYEKDDEDLHARLAEQALFRGLHQRAPNVMRSCSIRA